MLETQRQRDNDIYIYRDRYFPPFTLLLLLSLLLLLLCLTTGCHTMPSAPPVVKNDHHAACIGRARAVVARANTIDCAAAITFPSNHKNMT